MSSERSDAVTVKEGRPAAAEAVAGVVQSLERFVDHSLDHILHRSIGKPLRYVYH